MDPGSRPTRPISGARPELIREWPTYGSDRTMASIETPVVSTSARTQPRPAARDSWDNQPDGLFMRARVMGIRRCRLRTNQTDSSELSVRRAKRLEIENACLGARI